jgi:hypothetical protein
MRLILLFLLFPLLVIGAGCENTPTVWFTGSSEGTFDTYRLYPAKVVIGNVSEKALVDTWTEDGYDKKFPDYRWAKGEPMTVNIHNGYPVAKTFKLVYEIVNHETVDKTTGLSYQPAPDEMYRWVTITATEVAIPANNIAHIPLSIKIPRQKVLVLPERWEFRIKVFLTDTGEMITTDVSSRFLISMR